MALVRSRSVVSDKGDELSKVLGQANNAKFRVLGGDGSIRLEPARNRYGSRVTAPLARSPHASASKAGVVGLPLGDRTAVGSPIAPLISDLIAAQALACR